MSAYPVPSSAGLIKLDAMENPYSMPDELREEWLAILRSADLNRYPDAAAGSLKQQIKNTLALPPACDVMLGNGSDELIQLLCLAVLDAPMRTSGRPLVLAPEPGFVMYRQTALATGLEYSGIPLRQENFALDTEAMLTAIERLQPEIIYLAYPNNPTGNFFDLQACRRIIEHAPGLVILDEAYHPFAEATTAQLLTEFDHVLLLRTFSKLGLAGIRFGLLAGAPDWLQHFEKLRLPYNINVLTQLTAEFTCRHYPVFLEQCRLIRQQRDGLLPELRRVAGLQVYDSSANFILFRVPEGSSGRIFRGLVERGILIKNMDKAHPMLRDCLRVTVGTAEENGEFINALRQLL